MMRFELFTDEQGKWRFRLVAANGKIVAQSEAYTRKIDALRTIISIRRHAATAEAKEIR